MCGALDWRDIYASTHFIGDRRRQADIYIVAQYLQTFLRVSVREHSGLPRFGLRVVVQKCLL